MIEAIAANWATKLKKAVPEHPASIAVIKFALQLFIETILTLLTAVVISSFTNKTIETLIVLIAFAILRAVSGGFHFKTAAACILSTSIGANIAAFSQFNDTVILVMGGTSLLLAAIFAPSKIENQTRIPKKYYPALKIISLVIISTNFLFMSSILASAFLIQSITLIRKRR
jgi:accessory gene regulator B